MSFLLAELKWKRSTKILGRIKSIQMSNSMSKEWLLNRINPKCENCASDDYYNIEISYHKPLVVLPIGKLNPIYKLVCSNCRETIELDLEEFYKIRPFINLNKSYDYGKIDEKEYNYRIKELERKLYD